MAFRVRPRDPVTKGYNQSNGTPKNEPKGKAATPSDGQRPCSSKTAYARVKNQSKVGFFGNCFLCVVPFRLSDDGISSVFCESELVKNVPNTIAMDSIFGHPKSGPRKDGTIFDYRLCLDCSRVLRRLYRIFKQFENLNKEGSVFDKEYFSKLVRYPSCVMESLEGQDNEVVINKTNGECTDQVIPTIPKIDPPTSVNSAKDEISKCAQNNHQIIDLEPEMPVLCTAINLIPTREEPAVHSHSLSSKDRPSTSGVKTSVSLTKPYEKHREVANANATNDPPSESIQEKTEGNEKEKGETFACSFCTKVLKTFTTLKLHIKRLHSTSSEQLLCPVCTKAFNRKYDVKRHVSNVHGKKSTEKKSVRAKKSIKKLRDTWDKDGEFIIGKKINSEVVVTRSPRPKRKVTRNKNNNYYYSDEENMEQSELINRMCLTEAEDTENDTETEDVIETHPVDIPIPQKRAYKRTTIVSNGHGSQAFDAVMPPKKHQYARKADSDGEKWKEKTTPVKTSQKIGLQNDIGSKRGGPGSRRNSKQMDKSISKKNKRGYEKDANFKISLGDDDERLAARDREMRDRTTTRYNYEDEEDESDYDYDD